MVGGRDVAGRRSGPPAGKSARVACAGGGQAVVSTRRRMRSGAGPFEPSSPRRCAWSRSDGQALDGQGRGSGAWEQLTASTRALMGDPGGAAPGSDAGGAARSCGAGQRGDWCRRGQAAPKQAAHARHFATQRPHAGIGYLRNS